MSAGQKTGLASHSSSGASNVSPVRLLPANRHSKSSGTQSPHCSIRQTEILEKLKYMKPAPSPDTDQAKKFLAVLNEAFPSTLDGATAAQDKSTFHFRAIWPAEQTKPEGVAGVVPCSSTAHLITGRLTKLNERGLGIFVMPQITNGAGVKSADVVCIRAVVADLDLVKEKRAKPDWPMAPTFEVESSPGNWQSWWLLDQEDAPLAPIAEQVEMHRGIMSCLVQKYGADPKAADPAHVFRVPGMLHTKARPVVSRLVMTPGAELYTWADLMRAFPAAPKSISQRASAGIAKRKRASQDHGPVDLDDLREALFIVPTFDPAKRDDLVEYEQWVRIGAALHDATDGGENGFDMWREWSATWVPLPGKTVPATDALETKWRSFSGDSRLRGKEGGRATAGTIFFLAKQRGWKRPSRSPFASLIKAMNARELQPRNGSKPANQTNNRQH